jgi:FMN-dependent oxidoreductase (nitrilotriacetate monooxygenase family)
MSEKKRQLHLAAFYFPPGSHAAGWRLPEAKPESDMTFSDYVHLARTAERGKFDTIFFQDTVALGQAGWLATDQKWKAVSSRAARLEPLTMLSALAMLTERIGLIATATTTYNEPYNVARKYATLDAISGGRAGWNLVTSQIEDEAQNFGADHHMDHGARYERAEEFHDVVVGLWDSWEDGAVIKDKASGTYFDQSKVHALKHKGPHFSVRGPLNVARSPQGRPVIAQAGSSGPGKELAARTAEIVFTAQPTIEAGKAFYADLKDRLAKYGRSESDLKILPGLIPIVGRTEQEARDLYLRLQSLIRDDIALEELSRLAGGLDLSKFPLDGPLPDLPPSNSAKARQELLVAMARQENLTIRQLARRFAEGTGHNVIYGTPLFFADMMEEWINERAADGFTILFPYFPKPVDDFVDLVVPELQRRGIFRTTYKGSTLRSHLNLRVPRHPSELLVKTVASA